MKIDEILKMLDLPELPRTPDEESQLDWLSNNLEGFEFDSDEGGHYYYKGESIGGIADLAFRMRDETGFNFSAQYKVYMHEIEARRVRELAQGGYPPIPTWFSETAQAIHWIAAALIARELKEQEE